MDWSGRLILGGFKNDDKRKLLSLSFMTFSEIT